ncbi:MAG: hypothetical protein JOZ38_03605 [Candidatus Eremiobacteraeota bacterium]|nr:hypothetical protein [Candidatus Eremiobacteraeota bacterium]
MALSTATSAAYQFTGNFLYAAAGPNRSTYGSSGAGDISYFASTLGPATTTITDANGNVQGLATDSAGNVYAAIAGATNEIDEFAPGLPSSTPTRSVVVSSAPFSVALDGSGNIYVQESGQVEIYPANATLHTPPTTTLGGTNTGLPATAGPQQIGVDAAGDIFAVVSFFSTVEIGVFRAGAQSGNVGPSPTIQLNTPNITNAYLAPVLTVSGTTLYASVNGFAAHGDEYVVTLPSSSSGTITPANSYLYGAEDPTIWSLSIGT